MFVTYDISKKIDYVIMFLSDLTGLLLLRIVALLMVSVCSKVSHDKFEHTVSSEIDSVFTLELTEIVCLNILRDTFERTLTISNNSQWLLKERYLILSSQTSDAKS